MRRFFALFLFVCLTLAITAVVAEESEAAPSSVWLGHYEQDNHVENGVEPIEWIVLKEEEGKALLLSKYVLDNQRFHETKTQTSWENSDIRTWLNNEFISQAFTEAEQAVILSTVILNGQSERNPAWVLEERGNTTDRVFLLSYREVMEAFPEERGRKASGTEYARAKGAKFLGVTTIGLGESDWWLRSPGSSYGEAAYIGVIRDVNPKGINDFLGVRPAMWIDTTKDRSQFPYERFCNAIALQAEGQYSEAADIFETLEGYNDNITHMHEVLYLQAMEAETTGDYNTAIRLYENAKGFQDAYSRIMYCKYALGVQYQQAGDWDQAASMFEKAGQYQDSMMRLKECLAKKGIQIYYFGADPQVTGMDNGFSDGKGINGNDRHFGWRLGRFFMSGFTRVNGENTDTPVFIKTLGDSVTLWFELEQSIDALNGKNTLLINEDINGYNQYFGVSRTNFGRGTLIVRHRDYQNRLGDPQIYTDYLKAKDTSGADTKVVFREEGDYEVALNYEIRDNSSPFVAGYSNYQVFFRFSVRNGNCMVFPFDVLTGAELQNTAVTENGFYLDLARSRYLDIDVKRSVIISGPTGPVEDERFNRPAKDGDQYTAEGIYTISVSNRYTGESTVKTLFVGSDELLQEYISNGFSMERLK